MTGGSTDDRVGGFVRPTVLQVADPKSWPMTEELFAPVTAAYVYDGAERGATLQLVDGLDTVRPDRCRPGAAIHGRQPDHQRQADRRRGGPAAVRPSPSSGTNDKIGTVRSSIRFLSPRSVKRREG
jgi:1-pyrroline-5-carboxylate dehydrogenase